MVTITKGVKTFDGKIPVTLLVDDVETANELIKLAKTANVPVVEQEDVLNKSKNKTTQDKLKQIIKIKESLMALIKFPQPNLSVCDVLSRELNGYSRKVKVFPKIPDCVPAL